MPTSISGVKPKAWYQKKWFVEVISGLPPIGGTGVGAFQMFRAPDNHALGWILVGVGLGATIAVIAKVYHAVQSDKKETPEIIHDGLHGAMFVVHAAAAQACGLTLEDGLKRIRATFHRVVFPDGGSEPTEYEQVVNYVGRGGGGRDRRFSLALGITGLTIRANGDLISANRKNADINLYEQELVTDWGYTPGEAKKLQRDPMAWLAVPVHDSDTDRTIGIVYLDSTDAGAFDESACLEAIVTACLGLTKYVGQRYGQ